MKLTAFLGRYLSRYLGWVAIAILSALVYASSTVSVVALIEPIFGEVLLAGEQDREALGGLVPGAEEAAAAGSQSSIHKGSFKLGIERGYNRLKQVLGITPASVVYFVPLLVVVIFVLRSAADFVSGYSFDRIGLGITTDIRNDLYGRILSQSSRFHADHHSGELMSRIVSDVAIMQTTVSTRIVDLLQQSLTLIGLLYLLFSTHQRLALVCLVVLPVMIYPIVRFGRGMRRTSHKSQERMADLANLVGDGVRGHRVVKAFGMERFEFERFRKATARHLRVNLWARVLANVSSPVIETLGVLGAAVLLVYAGKEIRSGELSPPVFVAFLVNLFWMYDPVRRLNKVNLVLQQSLAAAHRVYDVMSRPNEIRERPGARDIGSVEREIRFDHISFAYRERVVLHDVDLTIRRGEMVALVGPSGAGKSTLVNLLPRFFDPDSGAVLIDGNDLRDLKLASVRALIGIVTQETILFNDTIRNNIAYGRADLPLERIREAAAAAYADQFIAELGESYDSTIGEGGLRLSGGQRQRLAIARALVKNPPILILDEATSQLDSESEALVQKALYNLMQGRTTLVIAHRLSTVQKADRIVVMDGGRIVEQGAHAELLALGGLYKRLYDLQFRI